MAKASPWVPESGLIAEESDRRLPSVVAVVLVDEQIDGGLTERDVVRRIIVSPQRCRIHAERMRGMLHIAGGQRQPCLDEILLGYDAVGPSPVGRPGVRSGVDELAINDRPRQYPAHMPCATKDRGPPLGWGPSGRPVPRQTPTRSGTPHRTAPDACRGCVRRTARRYQRTESGSKNSSASNPSGSRS